uniref:LRRCT domain-containing protein n=1 Tax=Gongylonema pulchrum TaxID=637853 RepID=A0A183EBV6_9BILA
LAVCRWNVRLRVLDVSNFFSPSVPLQERPRLLANTFARSANEFNDLQELIVRGNSLTDVWPDTFCKLNGLIRLATVDISSNPLNCDCALVPAIKQLSRSPSSSLNQGRAICAAPESRRGQNVFEIPDFECKSNYRLVYLALLVVALCIAAIFFRTYRGRVKMRRMPLVAGYSKLIGDNEQPVGPQFV